MPGTAEQGIVEVELLWFFDYFVGGQTERERERKRGRKGNRKVLSFVRCYKNIKSGKEERRRRRTVEIFNDR